MKIKVLPGHIKNYLHAIGADETTWLPCEICGKAGKDFHHVEPRSKFGSKRINERDHYSNIVLLCRKCHDDAHGPASRDMKIQLKEIVSKRLSVN